MFTSRVSRHDRVLVQAQDGRGERYEWAGGDVAASVPLGNRSLWLFGDTLAVQRLEDGARSSDGWRMPHASLGMEEDGKMVYYFHWDSNVTASTRDGGGTRDDGTASVPDNLFLPTPLADDSLVWLSAGLATEEGTLVVLAMQIKVHSSVESFAFGVEKTLVYVQRETAGDPSTWPAWQVAEWPGGELDRVHFSAALVQGSTGRDAADPWTYVLGTLGAAGDARAVMARIHLDDLVAQRLDRAEYLVQGRTWRQAASLSEIEDEEWEVLFSPGITETTLQFDERLDRWFFLAIPPFTDTVNVWTAEQITGPYELGETVYTVPEIAAGGRFAYACKVHKELSPGPGSHVFTYVTNALDSDSLFEPEFIDTYVPRFVRLDPPSDGSGDGKHGRDAGTGGFSTELYIGAAFVLLLALVAGALVGYRAYSRRVDAPAMHVQLMEEGEEMGEMEETEEASEHEGEL